jgi:hypothetical protein
VKPYWQDDSVTPHRGDCVASAAVGLIRQTVCPKCRPGFGWTYDIGCPARHPDNSELRCYRESGHRGMHLADDWNCTIEPTTILKGRTPTRLGLKVAWARIAGLRVEVVAPTEAPRVAWDEPGLFEIGAVE